MAIRIRATRGIWSCSPPTAPCSTTCRCRTPATTAMEMARRRLPPWAISTVTECSKCSCRRSITAWTFSKCRARGRSALLGRPHAAARSAWVNRTEPESARGEHLLGELGRRTFEIADALEAVGCHDVELFEHAACARYIAVGSVGV